MKKIKQTVFCGVAASLAIVLSYIEFLIPPIFPSLPAIKMGLPNIAIIFVLYKFGALQAASVSAVRLLISALLFGNLTSFLFSLAGAVLSFTAMLLLKMTDKFSAVGVSVAGGVCHNLGQIVAAILIFGRLEIGYYMIFLTISGTVAGIIVGLLGSYLIKLFNKAELK